MMFVLIACLGYGHTDCLLLQDYGRMTREQCERRAMIPPNYLDTPSGRFPSYGRRFECIEQSRVHRN